MDDDKLTDAALNKLTERALTTGINNYGLSKQDAEEFSQEYALMLFEKGWRQTPDQACIDYVRKRFGRTGTVSNINGKGREQSLSHLATTYGESFIERIIGFEPDPSERRESVERFTDLFEGRDRVIFLLRYKWGFMNNEIGHCFGITESRICQRLTEMEKRIQTSVQKKIPRRKQRKGERKKQSALPRSIQIRPDFQRKAEGIVEKIFTNKMQRMGAFQVEKIPKTVQRSFRVYTF